MVWSGKGVVKSGRVLLGETNPLASLPGTIRGDFCIDVGRNLCHGSDSVENAEKEIALWYVYDFMIFCRKPPPPSEEMAIDNLCSIMLAFF